MTSAPVRNSDGRVGLRLSALDDFVRLSLLRQWPSSKVVVSTRRILINSIANIFQLGSSLFGAPVTGIPAPHSEVLPSIQDTWSWDPHLVLSTS